VVRAGGDAHLADDLMQQLWVQAQNLAVPPEGEIELGLRTIARNLIRSHWRRQRRRPQEVPLPDARLAAEMAERLICEELPDEALQSREARDQLLLALTELPAAQQELLLEHYFHGRSQPELAKRLGLSERAVEGRLYRVRLALREKLQHLEPF
jgi:RNA polymerase sigma-70 factor (ECF subfamily)